MPRQTVVRPPSRSGFTLLEMLMVMGLLVVLLGLSWPVLRGPMENSRLRDAAAQVRNELARTRLAAMQMGRDQVLCFMPGSDRYCVAAADLPVDAATCTCDEASVPGDDEVIATSRADEWALPGGAQSAGAEALSLKLPEGVVFAVEETGSVPGAGIAEMRSSPTVGGPDSTIAAESGTRIEFHPDGTCSDATIKLANERGYEIAIEVRGLTAAATVGPLERSLADGGVAP